jgi:HK97 family phage prohead protease
MPMPAPRDGETHEAFMERCMSAMAEEFPDGPQRAAVCEAQWKDGPSRRALRLPIGPYERRGIAPEVAELRLSEPAEAPTIGGYAAIFDSRSQIIADFGTAFVERIEPGAFTKTLKEADVRALLNHDPNFVIGRTRAGTLRLSEDQKGLAYEADPPRTHWAEDLMETLRRGDISESSFQFQVVRDEWGSAKVDGRTIDERRLIELRLVDVAPVTFPAYLTTTSSVRTLLEAVDGADPGLVRAIVEAIQAVRRGPGPSPHPVVAADPAPGPSPHAGSVDMGRYRRWLERVAAAS